MPLPWDWLGRWGAGGAAEIWSSVGAQDSPHPRPSGLRLQPHSLFLPKPSLVLRLGPPGAGLRCPRPAPGWPFALVPGCLHSSRASTAAASAFILLACGPVGSVAKSTAGGFLEASGPCPPAPASNNWPVSSDLRDQLEGPGEGSHSGWP